MRRGAKTVNFGIVYGQTPFGLAAQLGIDRKEAEQYIRRYFETYAGVKMFIAEDHRTSEARRLRGDAVRTPAAHPGHEQPQPQRAWVRRTHRRQHAFARHCR